MIAVHWVIAMIVLDTWQYFIHRYIHLNRFLYKHVHAVHHAQIVPYVYGALYGHPLESLIVDIIGGTLAYLISGMTIRTSIYFFSFSLIKTLDLHSGLCILKVIEVDGEVQQVQHGKKLLKSVECLTQHGSALKSV